MEKSLINSLAVANRGYTNVSFYIQGDTCKPSMGFHLYFIYGDVGSRMKVLEILTE